MHISPSLSPKLFIKSIPSSNKFNNIETINFAFARGALLTAIHSLNQKYNNGISTIVWLPAYICDTVVILFKENNVRFNYYKVNSDLEPQLNSINVSSEGGRDIVILVNYFGFSMVSDEFKSFVKDSKMLLIYDYAHSISYALDGTLKQLECDAAIFGYRKILPLPDGAGLYLNNCELSSPSIVSKNKPIYRSPYKMVIQRVLNFLGLWKPNLGVLNKFGEPCHSDNYYVFDYLKDMSLSSKKIINTINVQSVCDARRSNYKYLYDEMSLLQGVKIPRSMTLESINDVPWVFFFYFNSANDLIKYLRKEGIPASYFPELHQEVIKDKFFINENNILKKSLTLPVHQDLTKSDLDHIVLSVKKFIALVNPTI
jgi:perosamine synthetase